MTKKTKSEEFCQAILSHFPIEGKILANLVMAVASHPAAKTVVEYSESPLFHYQYSSIYQLLGRLRKRSKSPVADFKALVQSFIAPYLPAPSGPIRLLYDHFPLHKPLSPTLAERGVVYSPNEQVLGNKPLEIGYTIAHLSQGFAPQWSVPLDLTRVKPSESALEVSLAQIEAYLKTQPSEQLVVGCGDSSFATAPMLSALSKCPQWVGITRLKNCNVYASAVPSAGQGSPKIYGEAYTLRRATEAARQYKNPKTGKIALAKPSIETRSPDQCETFPHTTRRNRAVLVQIQTYRQMRLRSKDGYCLKKLAFTLLVVDYLDAQTQQPIYKKPIYLALWGQKQAQITPQEAYFEFYNHRYDIEGGHRFMKQNLLLDKLQTPHLEHLELWLLILQLVQVLLFVAAEDVQYSPKKWQAYAPQPDPDAPRLSLAQTRRAAQTLFFNFDKNPFLPKLGNKGRGRAKGKTLPKKDFHPPRAKPRKKKNRSELDLKQSRNC